MQLSCIRDDKNCETHYESIATMSATPLLAQLFHHTLGLRSDAIERWAIEDWILLTVLVIEGVLLGWLVKRLATRVFSGA